METALKMSTAGVVPLAGGELAQSVGEGAVPSAGFVDGELTLGVGQVVLGEAEVEQAELLVRSTGTGP